MKLSEYDIYMETSRLAVHATTVIERAMQRAELTRSQLADAIGVSRSRVTKVLDGETNMTLRTLASFGLACGVRWHFVGRLPEAGELEMGWRDFKLTLAESPWSEFSEMLDAEMAVPDQQEGVPLCSASRASQDPLGPLIRSTGFLSGPQRYLRNSTPQSRVS